MNDLSKKQRGASAGALMFRPASKHRLLFSLAGAIVIAVGLAFTFKKMYITRGAGDSTPATKDIVKVVSQSVVRSFSLVGAIEPGTVVNVTAPFDGPVKERYVNFGMRVENGQELLSLNSSEVDLKMRDAEVNVIKAARKVEELRTWQKGSEVARARNSVLSAKLKVDELSRKEQESKKLLTRGIVPRNEYEGIVSELKAQILQLDAARQNLNAVLKKGDEDYRHVARLELENATKRRDELKRQSLIGIIKAPVAGLVILPPQSSSGKDNKKADIRIGSRLTKGQTLLAIADTRTLRVRAQVDEIDVNRIHEGQTVQVTGDAFGARPLMGKITQISAQANDNGSRGARNAVFEVIVAIEAIPQKLRDQVHIGMSAKLSVITYENPKAMVVPIHAVQKGNHGGAFVVRLNSETGQKVRVPVTVGKTLEDGIEISAGVKPGDSLVVESEMPLLQPSLGSGAPGAHLVGIPPQQMLWGQRLVGR